MSQRQRRRRDHRRKQVRRRGPARRRIAAGASIALGASLAATGSAQAATLTVTNLHDSGPGSVRQEIFEANQNGPGSDEIVFASGLSGTIEVGSSAIGSSIALNAETAMNIHGEGRITLRGGPNIDYVVYTGSNPSYGASPSGDPVTLSGLTITGGHAADNSFTDDGGGVYNHNASLTVSNSVISGNHANDDGGAIYTGRGSLTLVNSTVSGNTAGDAGSASGYGGAIYSQDSPVVIRNSTISGNSSSGDGGAIYMSGAELLDPSLTIENSTIANNASLAHGPDDEGGGVWVCCGRNGQRLDIASSTITGNSVGGGGGQGGGVYADMRSGPDDGSNATIRNTILAHNTGTTGNDLYLTEGGRVAFSLIEDPSNSTTPPAKLTFDGPDILGQDPQLGALTDNGGPTQTMALGPQSPALDAGAAFVLTNDQRGVQRPIDFPGISNAAGGDGSDIGAFEFQPDNRIELGRLKRNLSHGTAKQIVEVPLPGAGTLTISGKGLKTRTRNASGGGEVRLPVIPKGAKRRIENLTGKVKLRARITYEPTGIAARTLQRKLKLRKR